jgi:tetratricopeptide (TPR) repeat protein
MHNFSHISIIFFYYFFITAIPCVAQQENNDFFNDSIWLMMDGRTDEALSLVSKKLATDPNNVELLRAKAYIYFKQKNFEAGLVELEHAVNIRPEDIGLRWFQCAVQESFKLDKNIYLSCYRKLVEIMRITIPAENLLDNESYPCAVLLAELPEAEKIKQQYLKKLTNDDPMRQKLLNFDRKSFIGGSALNAE